MQYKIEIENKHGEKLVGVLHESGLNEIVVVCHGLRCTKVSYLLLLQAPFSFTAIDVPTKILSTSLRSMLFLMHFSLYLSSYHLSIKGYAGLL